jgi:hypothetical protein
MYYLTRAIVNETYLKVVAFSQELILFRIWQDTASLCDSAFKTNNFHCCIRFEMDTDQEFMSTTPLGPILGVGNIGDDIVTQVKMQVKPLPSCIAVSQYIIYHKIDVKLCYRATTAPLSSI